MNKSAFAKPFETTAVKKDGKVKLRNSQAFAEFSELLREGQELIVTFEKAHATRSLDQNALYWAGYVHPIADYIGRPPRVVHSLLKKLFLPKERIEIVDKRSGVVVNEVDLEALTTTTLNKIEFGDYLREIEEWVMDTFHGDVTVGSNREAA
jgi:hypothetical protein